MVKITRLSGPTVRLNLTADDWRLYNADTPDQEQDRDFVADVLNHRMELLIAGAPTRERFDFSSINLLLHGYSAWGAAETRTRDVCSLVLEEVYGR
jgi:hypothetical protein